jgi:uncharacterized RDD family membrane protein YckC
VSEEPEAEAASREPVDTTVVIETPEHVQFRHALAGPARRVIAYAVDTVTRLLVVAAFGLLAMAAHLSTPSADQVERAMGGVMWLLLFLAEWGYFVLFETLLDGQSPGKRLLGLRVVSATGRPLGFVDSVLRNVLRGADFLPMGYALGFAVMASDGKFRRLGDLLAGTLVVVEERRHVDDVLPKLAVPTEKELAALPAHVALLPPEREAIEHYLRRRPRLSESRAEELAELAARAIAGRSGVRYRSASRFLEILYFRALGGQRGLS